MLVGEIFRQQEHNFHFVEGSLLLRERRFRAVRMSLIKLDCIAAELIKLALHSKELTSIPMSHSFLLPFFHLIEVLFSHLLFDRYLLFINKMRTN
jgi:hypothetical protein